MPRYVFSVNEEGVSNFFIGVTAKSKTLALAKLKHSLHVKKQERGHKISRGGMAFLSKFREGGENYETTYHIYQARNMSNEFTEDEL